MRKSEIRQSDSSSTLSTLLPDSAPSSFQEFPGELSDLPPGGIEAIAEVEEDPSARREAKKWMKDRRENDLPFSSSDEFDSLPEHFPVYLENSNWNVVFRTIREALDRGICLPETTVLAFDAPEEIDQENWKLSGGTKSIGGRIQYLRKLGVSVIATATRKMRYSARTLALLHSFELGSHLPRATDTMEARGGQNFGTSDFFLRNMYAEFWSIRKHLHKMGVFYSNSGNMFWSFEEVRKYFGEDLYAFKASHEIQRPVFQNRTVVDPDLVLSANEIPVDEDFYKTGNLREAIFDHRGNFGGEGFFSEQPIGPELFKVMGTNTFRERANEFAFYANGVLILPAGTDAGDEEILLKEFPKKDRSSDKNAKARLRDYLNEIALKKAKGLDLLLRYKGLKEKMSCLFIVDTTQDQKNEYSKYFESLLLRSWIFNLDRY